jgi:hypothetical protein
MHTRFNSEGKLEHVLIHHVDDMIVFSENNEKADKVERELSVNLPLKLLGRPILFLGIDFMYLPNGDLKLHQETFMTKLLLAHEQYGIIERNTPAPTKRLQKIGVLTTKPFRPLCGSLVWGANRTWPQIAYYVHQISQFASCGTEEHWQAAMHLLGYIKARPADGIIIRKTKDPKLLHLRYWSDADFAGAYDLRSVGGYFAFAYGALISWSCTKIRAVVLSVHESEIYMMSLACREAKWMVRLIEALHNETYLPITINCDNQGAICTSLNERMSSKTKHIEVRNLYVREATAKGLVRCNWVPSAHNLADLLTKPLARTAFTRLAHGLAWGIPPIVGETSMEER